MKQGGMYKIEVNHLPPKLEQFYSNDDYDRKKVWLEAWEEFLLKELRKGELPHPLKPPVVISCTEFHKGKPRKVNDALTGVTFFQYMLKKYGYLEDVGQDNVSSVVLQSMRGKRDKSVFCVFEQK